MEFMPRILEPALVALIETFATRMLEKENSLIVLEEEEDDDDGLTRSASAFLTLENASF